MDLQYKENTNIFIINFNDNSIDFGITNKISIEIEKIIEKSDGKDILLDMSSVNYLDSTGLGMFVKFSMKAKELGKKLALINLKENIYRLFTISNLHNIVSIFHNENEYYSS